MDTSKKQKTQVILLSISIFLLIISFSTFLYAWLIYEKNTEEIDATTTGIKYVYEVNNELKVQSSNYTISNVVFFDIDDPGEIDYFIDMACVVQIDIRNTGDIDLQYTIEQIEGSPTETNTAGILCLFSNTLLDNTDLTDETISDMINITQQVSTIVTGTLNKYDVTNNISDEDTYYLYIIGVQTNDQETNDFLSNSYNFALRITAVSIN